MVRKLIPGNLRSPEPADGSLRHQLQNVSRAFSWAASVPAAVPLAVKIRYQSIQVRVAQSGGGRHSLRGYSTPDDVLERRIIDGGYGWRHSVPQIWAVA